MTARTLVGSFVGLLFAGSIVCGAQRAAEDALPSVSFGPFPLPLKRTSVFSALGKPATKADLPTPFPDDFPPSATVMLEDVRKFPSGQGRYYFPSRNVVRVYRISGAETAPYRTIQSYIKSLRKMLSDRPSAIAADQQESLPDYPPRNAGHCFEIRLSYIDGAWGSAVCYLTQFTQDAEDTPANNEELTYIVQGLSKDGQFYVAGDFSITHPKLPNGVNGTPKRGRDYSAADDRDLLSRESDRSFTPALDKIRTWLAALEIK